MLFSRVAWQEVTSFILMNELLRTRLLQTLVKYPSLRMNPEAHAIFCQMQQKYHANLELLDFVTDKLHEKDHYAKSSLTEEGEHANKIRDILNQIYVDPDTK